MFHQFRNLILFCRVPHLVTDIIPCFYRTTTRCILMNDAFSVPFVHHHLYGVRGDPLGRSNWRNALPTEGATNEGARRKRSEPMTRPGSPLQPPSWRASLFRLTSFGLTRFCREFFAYSLITDFLHLFKAFYRLLRYAFWARRASLSRSPSRYADERFSMSYRRQRSPPRHSTLSSAFAFT